jgi:hypothetical protein
MSAAIAWWLLHGLVWWWMPLAVAAGYAAHIAGDCLTGDTKHPNRPHGCALVWPARRLLGVELFTTGHGFESKVLPVVLMFAVWLEWEGYTKWALIGLGALAAVCWIRVRLVAVFA